MPHTNIETYKNSCSNECTRKYDTVNKVMIMASCYKNIVTNEIVGAPIWAMDVGEKKRVKSQSVVYL